MSPDYNVVPEFTNAKEFAKKKIAMLKTDFCIPVTEREIKHLFELTTESEINRAVRQIIENHWG